MYYFILGELQVCTTLCKNKYITMQKYLLVEYVKFFSVKACSLANQSTNIHLYDSCLRHAESQRSLFVSSSSLPSPHVTYSIRRLTASSSHSPMFMSIFSTATCFKFYNAVDSGLIMWHLQRHLVTYLGKSVMGTDQTWPKRSSSNFHKRNIPCIFIYA